MAPSRSLIWSPISKAGHPFQSLGGSGLISAAPGHMGQFGDNIILDPLVTPSKLGQGGLQFPPWTIRTKNGQKGQKWPNMARTQISKKVSMVWQVPKMNQNLPKGPQKAIWSQSSRMMGTGPFLDMHIQDYGARKGLKRLWPIFGGS
ncbi:hypothetical protein O181_067077 [Austropuccinia psidii MF-1]|uniref:Uncharacterized protein n=1 Tax=Austropuccinia psidii MF-1 TaxID=1389203 RepID=A0A9Q3EWN6_9BASI|nr:hypothetical protein [Austropuccinia psidii MF-1]